jgi:hypothetical protein
MLASHFGQADLLFLSSNPSFVVHLSFLTLSPSPALWQLNVSVLPQRIRLATSPVHVQYVVCKVDSGFAINVSAPALHIQPSTAEAQGVLLLTYSMVQSPS